MSHKATNWLSSLDADVLSNSEFRVLFHLCDCHNPSRGCFPTQSYLLEVTGVSNGTLNNALGKLEDKGLIRREKDYDEKTHRQKPTHYILGFEKSSPQGPTPETGDGIARKPTPNSGDGADSKKHPEPTPINTPTRLHFVGDGTSKEPVKNQNARAQGAVKPSSNPQVRSEAEGAVRRWREGSTWAFDNLPEFVKNHILAAGLLTDAERERLDWAC